MLSVAPAPKRLWIPLTCLLWHKRPGQKFRCGYFHKTARTDHLQPHRVGGVRPPTGPEPQEGSFPAPPPGEDFPTPLGTVRHWHRPVHRLIGPPPCQALPGLSPHLEPCRETLPPSNPDCPPGLLITGPCAPMTSTHTTSPESHGHSGGGHSSCHNSPDEDNRGQQGEAGLGNGLGPEARKDSVLGLPTPSCQGAPHSLLHSDPSL